MPGNYSSRARTPSVALRFIIVGGGIAGLATAYALRDAGHHVLVLEQSDGKARSHGGIRSPPNMTRLLRAWGLGPFLAKVGVQCHKFTYVQGETGEELSQINLDDDVLQDIMTDSFFVQHGDLQTMLFELAEQAGVEFRFGAQVDRVSSAAMSVYLTSGETLAADVIIGADGCNSTVRRHVLGKEPEGTVDTHITLSFTVSTDAMRRDSDLLPLTENSDWTIWLSDDNLTSGYLTHGRQEYSFIMTYPSAQDVSRYTEQWNVHNVPYQDLDYDFDQLEPRLRKLVKLAKTATPTSHVIRGPFDSTVCDAARIALVGDAAHSLMPNGSHNFTMSIEDAATLAGLFAGIQHASQIPRMLSAYEEIRQPRCTRAQQSEHDNRRDFCAPRGPAQKARDAALRASARRPWDDVDPDFLLRTWGVELDLFTYDAPEAVEEWWSKWGSLLKRGSALAPGCVSLAAAGGA